MKSNLLLNINWKKVKNIVGNMPLLVSVDGEKLTIASMKEDYSILIPVNKGSHIIETMVLAGLTPKSKIEINVQENSNHKLHIKYSKVSGNVKLEDEPTTEDYKIDDLKKHMEFIEGKKLLCKEHEKYMQNKHALIGVSERTLLFKSSKYRTILFLLWFLLGIIPAIIYHIYQVKKTKCIKVELNADNKIEIQEDFKR